MFWAAGDLSPVDDLWAGDRSPAGDIWSDSPGGDVWGGNHSPHSSLGDFRASERIVALQMDATPPRHRASLDAELAEVATPRGAGSFSELDPSDPSLEEALEALSPSPGLSLEEPLAPDAAATPVPLDDVSWSESWDCVIDLVELELVCESDEFRTIEELAWEARAKCGATDAGIAKAPKGPPAGRRASGPSSVMRRRYSRSVEGCDKVDAMPILPAFLCGFPAAKGELDAVRAELHAARALCDRLQGRLDEIFAQDMLAQDCDPTPTVWKICVA
ncbi:hypothetical protein M885DRAFT_22296 [Pelagophyceae sp. CCMP2097]|nr:hypothetical protein M885DRAFT_22296 [Pelagophyceae sp. CCMP2097]